MSQEEVAQSQINAEARRLAALKAEERRQQRQHCFSTKVTVLRSKSEMTKWSEQNRGNTK